MVDVSSILLILALVTALLVAWLVSKLTSRPAGNIPPVVTGKPLIGSAVEFGASPLSLFQGAYKKFGSVFTLKVFHEHMIFFAGQEAQAFFFKMAEDTFNAAEAYKFTVPVFGEGVVYDGPPELLIEERKMVSAGLSLKRFKEYIPKMQEECDAFFAQRWKGDSGEDSLFDMMNELTVCTSLRCIQGDEIRGMASEFVKLYWTLDESLGALAFFFPNLPMPSNLRRNKARQRMGVIFQDVIDRRRASQDVRDDLVQTLMESKFPNGDSLPDSHIIGMMTALLLAGQHTSNVTGTWTGLQLLHDSDALQRCIKEQDEMERGDISFESVKNSKFLEACVRETLRLRPPIIAIFRRVVKDTSYEGYDIPAGTMVACSPFLSMRLEEIYPNANDFIPDRMLAPRNEHKQANAFLAFGAGRHACIGESFAYLQVKAIWSYILRNFEIESVAPMNEPDFTTMIAGPKGATPIRWRRRK